MWRYLIPMLLLTTVSLSTSNVLPKPTNIFKSIILGVDRQSNDNMFSHRFNREHLKNIFYTVPFSTLQNIRLPKKITKFYNSNNRAKQRLMEIPDDNYNGEGFRKEQWHNYPRQLDRLHEIVADPQQDDYTPNDIRNADTGQEQYGKEIETKKRSDEISIEYVPNGDDSDDQNTDIDPLMILQIRLASERRTDESRNMQEEGKRLKNEINPINDDKEESIEDYTIADQSTSEKKTVNKRLFSLWSRLQTLSHQGHQLPHRRHLAFYGLPEGQGGALTAETRASLMQRPPGSPLRWG